MSAPVSSGSLSAGSRTFCPPEGRRFALIAAILASSMGFIDGTVVSLAMPVIRTDLGASLAEAQWIGNAYMLFLSALVLIGGVAGDVFGVRNIFAVGIAIFIVTSLFCAIAADAQMLIAMRALQGTGAALMVPGSLALIAKSYPADIRGAAIGKWAAYSSLATAFGPVIGGAVLSTGEPWMWRIIFAINVPIGVVALMMLIRHVPADRPSAKRPMDVLGAVLATAGLGLLAWGLTDMGAVEGSLPISPGMRMLTGIALLAGFVFWERRAHSPMVKLQLFRYWAFSGANLYTLVLFFAFSAVLFFMPMTLVAGWGTPEWQVSLLFLPMSLSIALFSGLAGRLADRWGPRWPLTIGALVVAMSYALLAITLPAMELWGATFLALVLNGLGMAILVSPLSAAVMLAVPDDDTGLASGINNAVARAAGLLAVAALGALAALVFRNVLGDGIEGAGFGEVPKVALDTLAEGRRVTATNSAFQVISGISAILCTGAAVISWLTQQSWPDRGKTPAPSGTD